MKSLLILAFILIGFTSMGAQIVLLREIMVVFYGNELSLGIALAAWLFWVALGSGGLGRLLVERVKDKVSLFALGEILLALLLPASILLTRAVPRLFGISPGEIPSVLPMIFSSLAIVAPICLTLGFLFVLGCRIFSSFDSDEAGQVGHVYVWEGVGAVLGGLLTSLFFIRLLVPLAVMFSISLVNLAVAFCLCSYGGKRRVVLPLTAGLITATLWVLGSGKVSELRRISLNLRWRNYHLVESENSIYGNISLTRENASLTFFNNGLYSFTVPDEFTSEQVAHFALLEHPQPKNVLLIGGGISGILTEILKHPVEKVDYLELDPVLLQMARRYIRSSFYDVLNDPRVTVENIDGKLFVKRTCKSYDVIIVNLPEPSTAQINRFYTVEFFKSAEKILQEEGVIFFGVSSQPNYIGEELRRLLVSLNESLKRAFADVIVIPGETNYFVGCKKKGILTLDYKLLMERLRERRVDTRYVREYYLASELSSERIRYLEERLKPAGNIFLNYDFHPICYYYDMVLWSTQFKSGAGRIFAKISSRTIYYVFAGFCCSILLLFWSGKSDSRGQYAILTAVSTTGFAEMTYQVITLLSFQIIYGYVYYKLSIILTSFMIGLILGGRCAVKMMRAGNSLRNFIQAQVGVCVYPFILPILFLLFNNLETKFTIFLGSTIVFPLLPVAAGFIGGFQFPLANKIYLQSKPGVVRSAGLTYGVDLIGSCLGAFLVSVFLVPIVGIIKVCVLVALLNITSLVVLLRAFEPYGWPFS